MLPVSRFKSRQPDSGVTKQKPQNAVQAICEGLCGVLAKNKIIEQPRKMQNTVKISAEKICKLKGRGCPNHSGRAKPAAKTFDGILEKGL